jgi:hypothetical protein
MSILADRYGESDMYDLCGPVGEEGYIACQGIDIISHLEIPLSREHGTSGCFIQASISLTPARPYLL